MSKPLIIANWKSNPASIDQALLLAKEVERGIRGIKNAEVVVTPPYPFLFPVARVLKQAKLGAQDTGWEDVGPFTGEVSWRQLKYLKAHYVIIGHSERKLHLGETGEMINKKLGVLLEHGMTPILCIGGSERRDEDTPGKMGEELRLILRGISGRTVKNLVVAYEPIWAVSSNTGSRPDTPENAFRASLYIRRVFVNLFGRNAAERVRIIYGGSVNRENAASFLEGARMQGVLAGVAGLNPKEFVGIVRAVSGTADSGLNPALFNR